MLRNHLKAPIMLAALMLVPVMAVQAQFNYRVVAYTGQSAPGTDGATFQHATIGGLNNDGTVLFTATLAGGDATDQNNIGVWVDEGGRLRQAARMGDPLIPKPSFQVNPENLFRLNLSPDGFISLSTATYRILAENQGGLRLLSDDGEEDPVQLVQIYRYFPGTRNPFLPYAANAGNVVFRAVATPPGRGPSSDGFDPLSLWMVDAEGTRTAIAIGNRRMPGVPERFTYMRHAISPAAINPSGQVVYAATGWESLTGDRIDVLYRFNASSGHEVLLASPTRFEDENYRFNIEAVTINGPGDAAVLGTLPPDAGSTVRGIYVVRGPGQVRRVVRIGDEAPGAGGATFSRFVTRHNGLVSFLSATGPEYAYQGSFVIRDDGRVVLQASLSDGRRGIWMETESGLEPIAIQGTQVPGFADGVTFTEIPNMSPNNAGEVAFSATIAGPGVTFNNNHGVWIGRLGTNGQAELDLVLRRNDQIEVEPGVIRPVLGLRTPRGHRGCGSGAEEGVWGTGQDGFPAWLNDEGALLIEVCFSFTHPEREYHSIILASRSLVVNSTGDAPDNDPGDGKCDTGGPPVNGRPECTLRAAIMEANAREGKDRITYDIPGDPPYVIEPESPLPVITDPVDIIGGTMQEIVGKKEEEALPAIVLDGSQAGAATTGVTFAAGSSGSQLYRHSIIRFRGNGIVIEADGVEVRACRIGINVDANQAGNDGDGIQIREAKATIIGGRVPDRNIIAYNENGILIIGMQSEHNLIANNWIIEQRGDGIIIREASRNQVGGVLADTLSLFNISRGNLISGNKQNGILIDGPSASANVIQGNHIGTNTSGTTSWANSEYGIRIVDAPENIVGGSRTAGFGNLISGNLSGGVLITGRPARKNQVSGNVIGLTADLTGYLKQVISDRLFPSPFPVGAASIAIEGAPDNVIGGTASGGGNIIGGDVYGITIKFTGARNNRVIGNIIGNDSIEQLAGVVGVALIYAGANSLGDSTSTPGHPPGNLISRYSFGILISVDSTPGRVQGNQIRRAYTGLIVSGNDHVIGGHDAATRNVIQSVVNGMMILGDGNRIVGNYVGVDVTGSFVDYRQLEGIQVRGERNVIGGPTETPGQAPGNVVSGFRDYQMFLRGNKNIVSGNLVGPSATGQLREIPDPRVHTAGILVTSSENLIGGAAGAGNIVSGNVHGMLFIGNFTAPHFISPVRNIVASNRIGTGFVGNERWGNRDTGIKLDGDAIQNVIGGGEGGGNIIANNGFAGIEDHLARGTEIINNDIHDNGKGAILSFSKDGKVLYNRFVGNGTAIEHRGESTAELEGNIIVESSGPESGIHLSGGRARIYGNLITRDAGDAIVLENGAEAIIERNNIFGNTGFGLLSLNPSGTIVARDNWWGHPSGPAGSGPGTGDRVSAGVDFSNWRTSMVALVAAVSPDTLYVTAGAEDSAFAFFRNWVHPNESINVSLTDERDWLQNSGSSTIDLEEEFGGGTRIAVSVPPGTAAGTISQVTVTAASQTDPADEEMRTLVVAVYEAALHRIAVSPDTVQLLPGQSDQFAATGFDQQNRSFTFAVAWSATGGTITEDGLYTAGGALGEYVVTASDGNSGISGSAVVRIVETVSTEPETEAPATFALHPNYPNPFNPTTTISFDVPQHAHVVLKVYDLLGREVAVLVDGDLAAGHHTARFDASGLPSGMYVYVIRMGDFRAPRRMVVVK